MKKINEKLKSNIFYIIILIITLNLYLTNGVRNDFKVMFTNFIIITISLIFIRFGDKYMYSLNKMVMLFSFFFFGIAPLLQYKNNISLWSGLEIKDELYFKMNILIILILIVYQALYYFFTRISFFNFHSEEKVEGNSISIVMLLILAISSFLITIYINNFNFYNLLLRSGGESDRVDLGQSLQLIYALFIRPMPVVCLVIFKMFGQKIKKVELILILVVLLSNFPTSGARFYIAALYIPLLLLYFKNVSLVRSLVYGLLLVFPLLDQSRRVREFNEFRIDLDFHMFLQGHFDSYQMFLRVIESNLITMGNQLLTSLLFFVPRSVWTDKSIGSGALVSIESNLAFNNVSMNFFGEGYINFGYFGILVFTLILAFVNAQYDRAYWIYSSNKISWITTFYLFLLGLQIFILRGDLLSSFAYSIGILCSVIFVFKVVQKKGKSTLLNSLQKQLK